MWNLAADMPTGPLLQWAGGLVLAGVTGWSVFSYFRSVAQQDEHNKAMALDVKAHHEADDVRFLALERAHAAHLVDSTKAHADLAAAGVQHETDARHGAIERTSGLLMEFSGELKELRENMDAIDKRVTHVEARQMATPAPVSRR